MVIIQFPSFRQRDEQRAGPGREDPAVGSHPRASTGKEARGRSWGAGWNEGLPGLCSLILGWWPVTKAQKVWPAAHLPFPPHLHGLIEGGGGSKTEHVCSFVCVCRPLSASSCILHVALRNSTIHAHLRERANLERYFFSGYVWALLFSSCTYNRVH